MIERRKYPRWKQAPEFLPPSRKPVLLPLIVIPMMVYLNASPAVQQSAGPRTASAVAGEAPVQGVNGKGAAYVWERNPKYPVIEFVMILTNERR